jgi:hypothetical protein
MNQLSRDDLLTLESYAQQRSDFRTRVMQHKINRRVDVGPNLTFYFEDRLTVQYQVQEMLRIEKIFESAAIEEELSTYNPLIPDGNNWKATAMLEFKDVEIRRQRLSELGGMEHLIWAQVDGFDRTRAIANEDLERSTDKKTSAVHFLRFELTGAMIAALKADASLTMGCDHPRYQHQVTVEQEAIRSLINDLD